LTPGKIFNVTHQTEGWMGSRADMNVFKKRRISIPVRNLVIFSNFEIALFYVYLNFFSLLKHPNAHTTYKLI